MNLELFFMYLSILLYFIVIFLRNFANKEQLVPANKMSVADVEEPVAPLPEMADEEYQDTLKILRRDWKWAAASDFIYKFNAMLRLDFLDLAVSLTPSMAPSARFSWSFMPHVGRVVAS